jgi:Ca2+-transporting ATPase
MSGAGRAVVLAVGENTRHEMELTDSDLQAADSQKTAMTEKLEEFGDLLSKYAKFAAILILVILTVYQFMYILIGSTEFISGTSLFTLIDNIQITIALLIVCVPEGLPLAVSMSMAFSIDRLIDDNLLIKNLEALETSGSVHLDWQDSNAIDWKTQGGASLYGHDNVPNGQTGPEYLSAERHYGSNHTQLRRPA